MSEHFTFFSLALRNIKRKPVRTGILIFSISLLVSTLVFALSFVKRVDSGIKKTSDRLGADIIVVPTGSRGAAEDVLLENKVKTFYMDKGLIEKVKSIRGIEKVTHQIYLVTLSGLCCDVPESMVVAFDQETDFVVSPWLNKSIGRRLKQGEAIVGNESAFNISFGLVDVDSVLFGSRFKMVGVLDKTGTGFDTALFVDENNIDDIIQKGKSDIKPGRISIILAKVKSGHDPVVVAAEIEDSIIEVDSIARKDIGKNIINTLKDINRIFFITVFLSTVLSVFLAWGVFSAVVSERSREVGIMRAIGAKEAHIVKLFFSEVVVIGLAGSIIGIAFGTVFSFLLAKNFSIMKSVSIDLFLSERIIIAAIGLIAGLSVCIVGALLPIYHIKKMEPLIVIKSE